MKKSDSNSCNATCGVIEDLNRQQHYFVSKISHEIRNPLTLVYSSLQLIEKKHPELPSTELWGQIKQDIQDTIVLLNDLSVFNNSSDLKMEPLSLSDFLNSVASSFRPSSETHGFQFLVRIPENLPIISANSLKLKEALLNLLRNAEDALAESSTEEKQIYMYAEFNHPMIHIHVRDNGTGILPEYVDTLFDPFVTHKQSGTGLGLGIVKNIAMQHGGSVSIDSDPYCREPYTDVCMSIPLHKSGQTLTILHK